VRSYFIKKFWITVFERGTKMETKKKKVRIIKVVTMKV
jgi:hypothetical protein